MDCPAWVEQTPLTFLRKRSREMLALELYTRNHPLKPQTSLEVDKGICSKNIPSNDSKYPQGLGT